MSRATVVRDHTALGAVAGVVAVTTYVLAVRDASLPVSVAIVAVSIGLLLVEHSKRRCRRACERDPEGVLDVGRGTRPPLPADPESGEYQCLECGAYVTVGPSGTEYGHAIGSTSGVADRCLRRPAAVDPDAPDGGELS